MYERKGILISTLLVLAVVNICGAMELATNFWNKTWGNTWHDYFAEGVDWGTTTNPWRQDFLNDMAPYTALRFMDWVPTNNSTVGYWSERISKTANHYGTAGVAYEWQIDLCNRVGADIWITVPHLTVEDYEADPCSNYWVSLANLIKQQLDPNLNVIVEYSNETWNSMFTQGSYCGSRGVSMGFDPDSYSASFFFHVYAAMRLHKVFLDVFSDQPSRVRTVICGQAGSGWEGDKNWGCYCQMRALQNSTINPWGLVPDYYSIAPYAGGGLNGASATIRTEWTASVAGSVEGITAQINTMDAHYTTVLPICLYESGQHILTNSHIFAQNPESYDMYLEYLNAIDDQVAFGAHYTHTGTWASGGAWGAKESTWQSLADAHKYRALLDYANSHASEPPEKAKSPVPADTEPNVPVITELAWAGGRWAVSHDVYFGTSAAAVAAADNNWPQFKANQTTPTYNPGPLANNTTCYWRIDEVNPHGTTTGDVWSFTTESPTIRLYATADASSQSGDCDTPSLSFSEWNYAFIKFDLSNVVPPLVSAKLRLYYESSQPLTIIISDATTDVWTECVSTPSGPGGTVVDSNYAPGVGWYEFDVNSFVEAEAAGDDIITFTVTSDYGGWTGLGAREGPAPPELVIVQLNPPPGLAHNPNPADAATAVPVDANLSWMAGAGAASHDIYFGTAPVPPFIENRTATSYDPGPLSEGTTYFWHIDERNAYGATTGVTWSFTTFASPPGQATNPNPADDAVGVSTTADLSWTPGSGATSHDVYLGTTDPPPFATNRTAPSYDPGTMAGYVTYYWRIDEKNAGGTTTGDVWSFTTAIAPGPATSPSPADAATDVSRNVDLSWTPGEYTTSCDVYFGTISPPAFVRNQTPDLFDPGTMAGNTTHYWRIDDWNDSGLMTSGTEWWFTTGTDEGDGLVGLYYDNNDFTNYKLTRVDERVSFSWGSGSPDTAIEPDTFSVRWVGLVQPRYSETYTFTTNTNDGVRLWVDDTLIIDKWINQSAAWTGTIALQADQKYDIQMDYYESTGTATAYLRWSSASQAKQTIPQGRLFTVWPYADLNLDYFVNYLDVDILADQWLTTPDPCDPNCADFDDSGTVDFNDFAIMAEEYAF